MIVSYLGLTVLCLLACVLSLAFALLLLALFCAVSQQTNATLDQDL